jgi:DNA modification methylase
MTELIWDGKYKDEKKQGPVRIALPFQTIETVNEGTEARLRSLELFASGRETEWRNRLIWGDKKYVLPSLLPEFAGKVNLIYIDPPFDTGADFSYTATIPDHPDTPEDETTAFTKEPSILEQKAYRDTWGRGLDSYLQWFYEAVVLLRELLAEDGSLFLHCDYHIGHYIKTCLDEVFGIDNFRNELVWKSQSPSGRKVFARQIPFCHEILFWYSKGPRFKYEPQYRPYDEAYISARFTKEDNRGKYKDYEIEGFSDEKISKLKEEGRIIVTPSGRLRLKQYLHESKGVMVDSVWTDIAGVNSQAIEDTGYDTQKPETLLGRILKLSSNEGDLVVDCFVGSGTTAVVAEKLNRRWIACDLGRFAIHTTRKRLLGIPNVRPFVVQNLGKYERQAWQAAEFGVRELAPALESGDKSPHSKELAYRKFILDLYHATPITGRTWLHGAKAGRMVHVGAVDAPVTLADVKAIAKEVWKGAGTGKDAPPKASVDILGWEFAFELNETAKQVAAESRVEVAFKKIPHEALDKKAVDQGDIKFFELGALSVDLKAKKREVTLKLSDFIIPIDDIPEEVRKAIKHWSQMVDYWAVDWDYKGDTFHNQWQSYRTRKNPKIELERTHTYPEPGKYMIVVKVIDLLGNDTTKTLEVRVG